MPQSIQIKDTPSQTFDVQLAGQACTINVYQKSTGLYCDLLVSGAPVIGGVICQNLNRIVRDVYLGFEGDLVFNDTQGSDDPSYPGLGSRYQMLYLSAEELNGTAA